MTSPYNTPLSDQSGSPASALHGVRIHSPGGDVLSDTLEKIKQEMAESAKESFNRNFPALMSHEKRKWERNYNNKVEEFIQLQEKFDLLNNTNSELEVENEDLKYQLKELQIQNDQAYDKLKKMEGDYATLKECRDEVLRTAEKIKKIGLVDTE
ncbi:hypothetical protein HJC23_008451 [Cyclotella cryptica]|uniref:Uncharacterized protein n=1 Tax=Cyclotella cryptica TaxID=29204 RepID=A0ABD3QYH6_9STRA